MSSTILSTLPLTTERLLIRPLREQDLSELQQLLADPEVMHFSLLRRPLNVEETRQRLDGILRDYERYGHAFFGLFLQERGGEGPFVGIAGLVTTDTLPGEAHIELAYRLNRADWGQGYATEACCAIRDWGFAHLPVGHFVSFIEPKNERSAAVAKRLGMSVWRREILWEREADIYRIDRLTQSTCSADQKISFVDTLPKDLENRRERGHSEYEASKGIVCDYKKFFIVVKNEAGESVGVLEAYTAFAEIYVDDIWVDVKYRGKGYGTKLMKALEQRFQGKGYNNINLVTSEFAAPDFYKKCGFEMEFVRKNKCNPQLTKMFFVKYFNNKVQKQGILE